MTDRIAYSVEEAAEAVGMSARTIRRAVADGELVQHVVRGSMPRILRGDLEAWIAAAPTERQSA
jgi:excisionase family DNA binding protein